MASSHGSNDGFERKPTIEFMVTEELKEEVEAVAGDYRMTKSEVMRAITRDGLERIDTVLEADDGAMNPREIEV